MTTATQTTATIPTKPLRRATNSLFRKLTEETVAGLRVENGGLYLERHEGNSSVSRWICAVDSQEAICMTSDAAEFRSFIESVTPTLSDPAGDTAFVDLSITAGKLTFQVESWLALTPYAVTNDPEVEPYFRVSAKAFKDSITAIESARAEVPGALQVLESFHFYCEGNRVSLLATDRFRAAKRTVEVDSLCEHSDDAHKRFMVDARLVESFVRSIQPNGEVECRLARGGDTVVLSSGEVTARIDAHNPSVDLEKLFTGNAASVMVVDAAQFKRAIKDAAPRVSCTGDVTFDMRDGRVHCLATTKTEPAELLNHGAAGHGTARFRVSLQYLLDGLRCIDCDKVTLFIDDDPKPRPIRFNPAGAQGDGELIPGDSNAAYILMPRRA